MYHSWVGRVSGSVPVIMGAVSSTSHHGSCSHCACISVCVRQVQPEGWLVCPGHSPRCSCTHRNCSCWLGPCLQARKGWQLWLAEGPTIWGPSTGAVSCGCRGLQRCTQWPRSPHRRLASLHSLGNNTAYQHTMQRMQTTVEASMQLIMNVC